jgi:tetratricopeptide (TPR) repeat protein
VTAGMASGRLLARALLCAAVAACSAPATLPELAEASARERSGDPDGAVQAYRRAERSCQALRPERRRSEVCSEAQLGQAEVLEAAQRTGEALAVYQRLAAEPASERVAATAQLRIGRLELARDRPVEAWRALWKCITDWPDEPSATDALRLLVADGRDRDPRALTTQLGLVLTAVAQSQVADNLVWSLADLGEHELAQPKAARALYDRLPRDYPQSGLRDDARWHAARISRAMGDPRGAATRLRALLATREVALGAGSYFSIWLDDAQLELGRVLRDDLHELPAAIAVFGRLDDDYPASTLIDDATWELARTHFEAGDAAATCRTIAELTKKFPDSRHVTEAIQLGSRAKCL